MVIAKTKFTIESMIARKINEIDLYKGATAEGKAITQEGPVKGRRT